MSRAHRLPHRRVVAAPAKRLPPRLRAETEWCPGVPHSWNTPVARELKSSLPRVAFAYPGMPEAQKAIRDAQHRKFARCEACGRRLRLRASYCIGGEFVCFTFPKHKTKPQHAGRPRKPAHEAQP